MYARYVAPIGSGLTVDAGKFATHMGYEVIGGTTASTTSLGFHLQQSRLKRGGFVMQSAISGYCTLIVMLVLAVPSYISTAITVRRWLPLAMLMRLFS